MRQRTPKPTAGAGKARIARDSVLVDQVTSIRRLGAVLGRSHVAVRKWLSHPAWPKDVPRRPPWTNEQAVQLKAWAADTLRPDRAVSGPDAMTTAETTFVSLGDALASMAGADLVEADADVMRRLRRAGVSA
jgi:hypothetical protein